MSVGDTILYIFENLYVYLSFIILIFGLIGNILNIFIFLNEKSFHKNQCVFYLISESIINSIQLLITFTSRICVSVLNYDPMQTSLTWCKIRSMIAQACTLISMTTVCLLVVDQYLSTHYNPRIRKKSTLELAQILNVINISIWLLHGIPFLLFFEIRPLLGCTPYNPFFLMYYKFFHFPILIGFVPISIALTFSILSYRNVRHIIQRQISHFQRKLDRQLTAMVLARVTFLILVTLPFVIYRIYTLIISTNQINSLEKRVQSIISNFSFLIFTLNFSV